MPVRARVCANVCVCMHIRSLSIFRCMRVHAYTCVCVMRGCAYLYVATDTGKRTYTLVCRTSIKCKQISPSPSPFFPPSIPTSPLSRVSPRLSSAISLSLFGFVSPSHFHSLFLFHSPSPSLSLYFLLFHSPFLSALFSSSPSISLPLACLPSGDPSTAILKSLLLPLPLPCLVGVVASSGCLVMLLQQ